MFLFIYISYVYIELIRYKRKLENCGRVVCTKSFSPKYFYYFVNFFVCNMLYHVGLTGVLCIVLCMYIVYHIVRLYIQSSPFLVCLIVYIRRILYSPYSLCSPCIRIPYTFVSYHSPRLSYIYYINMYTCLFLSHVVLARMYLCMYISLSFFLYLYYTLYILDGNVDVTIPGPSSFL